MTAPRPAVFVSYSHKDEAWKERLITHLRVLEIEGKVDVWSDRRIQTGDTWRAEIEGAVERASVAILIVTKEFLTSEFIRKEELRRILTRRASEALRVIPLIAEPCPWTAVADLKDIQVWPAGARPLSAGSNHEIDQSLAALALQILGESSSTGAVSHAPGSSGWPGDLPVFWRAAVLSVPTVALAVFAFAAALFPVVTMARLDLVTRRFSFVLAGIRSENLLSLSPAVSELTLERCQSVSFSAKSLVQVSDGSARDGRLPGRPYSGPVRIRCADSYAKISLVAAAGPPAPQGIAVLDRLMLEPGRTAVLEVNGTRAPVLTIDVASAQQFDLPIHRRLRITAALADIEPRFETDSSLVVFETDVSDTDRFLHVETSPRGSVVIVTPTGESTHGLLAGHLPISSVEFVDEQLGGKLTTPFVAEGRLTYPDHSGAPSVLVGTDEFLTLRRDSGLVLRRVTVQSNPPALALSLDGRLTKASIAVGGSKRQSFDPRLTLFQAVRYGPTRNVAVLAAVWLGATFCIAAWLRPRRPRDRGRQVEA